MKDTEEKYYLLRQVTENCDDPETEVSEVRLKLIVNAVTERDGKLVVEGGEPNEHEDSNHMHMDSVVKEGHAYHREDA